MKIIDMHAHIYPDRIATKASNNIGAFYDMPVGFDGRISTLLSLGETCGVERFVIHSVATHPAQVDRINAFVLETCRQYPHLVAGFATLHPDTPDVVQQIDQLILAGFKGVKLHPDFQQFEIDSPRIFPLYQALEGRLPVLIHTGDYRFEYSTPHRILPVMDRFADLDIICAHFGGWSQWEQAAAHLAGRRLWVDTSSSLYALSIQQADDLIGRFGVDRVLFGSDFPMWSPVDELAHINKLTLTDTQREKILYTNAKTLLNL